MNDDTQDRLQVSFPASDTFTRIGRVAVAGLALRLGLDISIVEQLRLAVDEAVGALKGPGRVRVQASWAADDLIVELDNPEVQIENRSELASRLGTMVTKATVDSNVVTLSVPTLSP